MQALLFRGFGKSFIKNQKYSPDSFVQMAIQYAFYRVHRTPGAHYETGAIRVFNQGESACRIVRSNQAWGPVAGAKHFSGRTDVIRSCSNESIAFAKKMLDNHVSEAEKMTAMNEAIRGHNAYARMTCFGQGIDRHLLGLRLIAEEAGMEVPDFFHDSAFTKSTHHRISSSQVHSRPREELFQFEAKARCPMQISSKHEAFVCYGPLVTDGYGCAYNIRDYDIIFGLSSMRSDPETCLLQFHDALGSSLNEMHDLAVACRNTAKL